MDIVGVASQSRGRPVLFALSVVVVVAWALASAGVGRAALTPKQYRVRAGAICTTSTNRSTNLLSSLHPTRSGWIAYIKADLRISADELRALSALDPPPRYRSLHLKILALSKLALDPVRAVIAKIKAGADPLKTFKAADKKIAPLDAAVSAAWRKIDVPDCYE